MLLLLFFLGLWCSVFSIYFLSKIILDSNQRRTKKPTRKATTASPRVCVLPSSMCHTILCHCPQSVFLVSLTTTQKVFLIFLTSNTKNPVSIQGRIWTVDTPRLSLLRITTTNNNPCVFSFFCHCSTVCHSPAKICEDSGYPSWSLFSVTPLGCKAEFPKQQQIPYLYTAWMGAPSIFSTLIFFWLFGLHQLRRLVILWGALQCFL